MSGDDVSLTPSLSKIIEGINEFAEAVEERTIQTDYDGKSRYDPAYLTQLNELAEDLRRVRLACIARRNHPSS